MTMPYESADPHLSVGAYALDALDTADRAAFEAHLAACESCRKELIGMAETTGLLAVSQQVTPPARLRSNVLAAIAVTPQLSSLSPSMLEQPVGNASSDTVQSGSASGIVAATGAPGTAGGSDAAPTTGHSTSNVYSMTSRRAPTATRLLAVAAAVLAIVAGGLGWRNATLSHDLDQAQAAATQVSAVLTAPDAATATGPVSGGGRGAVVSSASLDQAVIVTDDLPAPPTGKVYQLWFISAAGTATSAGLLPTSGGSSAQLLQGQVGDSAAVGISVEPAGGSPAPTTAPILAVKI